MAEQASFRFGRERQPFPLPALEPVVWIVAVAFGSVGSEPGLVTLVVTVVAQAVAQAVVQAVAQVVAQVVAQAGSAGLIVVVLSS